jgi:hypothetical protein
MLQPYLPEVESGKIDKADPSGEGFRDPFDQLGGCRPQQQEPSGIPGPIYQDPQQLEKIRPPLSLVDHHQPRKRFQNAQRS